MSDMETRIRIRQLESFVKRLKEALEYEMEELSKSNRCGEQFAKYGPCCSHTECHAIYRIRKTLASIEYTPLTNDS